MSNNKNLLEASQKVLALAEQRRARMAKAKAAPTAAPKAAPKAPAVQASPEAKAPEAPKVEAPAVEPKVEAPATPAVEPKVEAPAAAPVAAAAPVKAVENGGFAEDMAPVKESEKDVGEEDWGVHVPPEVESEVAEGKDLDDDMPLPGIMVPEGLEDSVMAVADPAALPADAEVRFDLYPYTPANARTAADFVSGGAHWVLLANGEPMAKIALADQPHAAQIAAHFVSAEFARSIVDGISKRGLMETLAAVKARTYVAKADESKKVKEIKARLEASAEEATRQRIAGIKTKYVESLGVVLEAAANNFIVENPVKDALIAQMTSLGLPEATAAQVVDDAFFAYGKNTIASFLDKAEEWANTPPEAMAAIKTAMAAAGRLRRPLPSALGAAHTNPAYNQQLANQMAASAVPVVSTSNENTVSASARVNTQVPVTEDRKQEMRRRIGGFGR